MFYVDNFCAVSLVFLTNLYESTSEVVDMSISKQKAHKISTYNVYSRELAVVCSTLYLSEIVGYYY